jgi:hypothetical protein
MHVGILLLLLLPAAVQVVPLHDAFRYLDNDSRDVKARDQVHLYELRSTLRS